MKKLLFFTTLDGIRYKFSKMVKIAVSRGFGGGDVMVDNFVTILDMNKWFGVRLEHQKRGPQLRGFVEIIISRKIRQF